MRFGYTILYVSDVASSLDFYERALGQRRRFLHESGDYAELDTGETALAFAAHELAAANLPGVYRPEERPSARPPFEVCFVTDNVQAAFDRAVEEGAAAVEPSPDEALGAGRGLRPRPGRQPGRAGLAGLARQLPTRA